MSNSLFCLMDASGHERFLGNIPGPLRYQWKVYGDVPHTPMLPRSAWDQYCDPRLELSPFLPPLHDQDGIGMCNASATVTAMEYQRAVQGLPHVSLSGGDLYGRINGGSDNGSMLEDGLAESMAAGVASTATCKYLDWRFRGQEAKAERPRYRVLEAFLCPTFEHCFSAVAYKFSLISGIMWYNNYDPDSDGWLPNGRGGGGGHAVFGYAPAKRGNQYGIWHQNSWGKWGPRQGRCVFPETAYSGPVGGWWAVRSMVMEEQDTPAPQF